jgi:four helix bundle protein
MEEDRSQDKYDLEERTYQFAHQVREFVKRLPKAMGNYEDSRQVIRASGSVGANYIEANESLGDKDFLLHIKISRKESKESRYWLRLLDLESKPALEPKRAELINESVELMRIFGAIFRKRSE